jgi:hypothetical protein
MRTLRRVGTGVLALTLATGLAACGDDSDSADSAETTTTAAEAENAAFCDAVLEFNSAVFQVDLSEDSTEQEIKATGEQLGPMFQTVVDEAPDSLSANAEDLNKSIQALNDGDASKFNADETFEKYTKLTSGAIDECDMKTIDVTAVDYAYQGVPKSIDAGSVAFSFTNKAEKEDHMMAIMKKKDGVDLSWDELLALPEDQAQSKTEFKGEAFAAAGDSTTALAALDPGDYAMVCFISVGSGEDGPPHFTKGMKSEFTVE